MITALFCFIFINLGYLIGRIHSEKLFISKILMALKEDINKPKQESRPSNSKDI